MRLYFLFTYKIITKGCAATLFKGGDSVYNVPIHAMENQESLGKKGGYLKWTMNGHLPTA